MKGKFYILAMTAIILAGCGGGGGSSSVSSGNSNTPPTANAGFDLATIVNSPANLVGSGSDSDGSIASYKWSEGSTTLGTSASLTYTPTTMGTHNLTLTVTDNSGATATDTVTVNAISASRTQKLLVVRVNFNNFTFTSSASVWANKIFGTSAHQLNHYYGEISSGNFQFVPASESDGASDGIVTTTISSNHPGNDDPANGDYHLWDTFKTALTQVDSKVNFASFDTNNDGAISKDELQIIFLVAGGETSTGWATTSSIWGMMSCYHAPTTTAAPTLDGKVLMQCSSNGDFARFGERQFSSSPDDATIGIIAHELGHSTFGLPDLYDIDYNSAGIGGFGLMSGGSWGKTSSERPGATPVHMTAWSKIKAGFITPITLTNNTATTFNIKGNNQNGYKIYKIDTNRAGEYFLVENRPPSGYDLGMTSLSGLSGAFTGGLEVLHIDENQPDNSDQTHKLVDIVEANNPVLDATSNTSGHINNLFFAGNKDTLPTSDTAQYNGTATGFEITNISATGVTMSADIKAQ